MVDSRLVTAHSSVQDGALTEAERLCRAALDDLSANTPDASHAATLLFVALTLQEKADEAAPYLPAATLPVPASADHQSDLGFAYFLSGDMDKAETLFEASLKHPDADGAAYNRLAALRLFQGDLDTAERLFREGLVRDPDRAAIHSNMGGVMVRQNKLDQALVHYERATALDPDLPQPQNGRAAVLIALERTDEEITNLERELETSDDPTSLLRRLSRILIHADRYQEADDRLREAWKRDEDNAEIPFEIGLLYMRQDRYAPAVRLFEKAAALNEELIAARILQIRALIESNLLDLAEDRLKSLEEDQADAYAVRLARAEIFIAREDYPQALERLNAIIDDFPGSAEAITQRGQVCQWTGDLEAAANDFERAAQLNPMALASLVQTRRLPDDPAVLNQMEKLAALALLPTDARAAMGFALTQAYAKSAEHDKAFDAAKIANAQIRKTTSYTPSAYSTFVDAIISAFPDNGFFEPFRYAGLPSSRPVFVVGMPRSGTTLTEQIIASHPDAFGAGELPTLGAVTQLMPRVLNVKHSFPACMNDFTDRTARHGAAYYLERIGRLNDTASRVVDKMPHNFQHLGLIALLFPNAKIIHLKRDPRDVAISNFFTHFKARRGVMGFSYDLADIGHMINDHDRIMAHWRAVLPLPIYELSYEALVDDFEAQTRALIDFVGLPWDDAVLDFHTTERAVKTASVTQVRQPLYKTSKARWKSYEAHLQPLLDVLNHVPS